MADQNGSIVTIGGIGSGGLDGDYRLGGSEPPPIGDVASSDGPEYDFELSGSLVTSGSLELVPRCIVTLPPGPTSIATAPTVAQFDQAPLDMYLDPVTLDYVDTTDGEWLEVADSRTLVMIQLEQRLGEAWDSPGDGTAIKAELESGDPVTPEFIAAETSRALQVLVADGHIADVTVGPITDATGDYTRDETGRFLLSVAWRDLASNTPVDLVYPAFER